ncbi:MAG: alpha-amylase family glycosyl hydrolase [Candidatus Marinimicrobia bacterium]|nr:alpha-amylase family glycosyl hydrolase [Candidatus Neomarinimicrobiota bacterium]
MKKIILLLIIFSVIGCNNISKKQNIELIPIQTIFVGDTLTINIQDLFFSTDYSSLEFQSNENIKINHNRKSNEVSIFCGSSNNIFDTVNFNFNNSDYSIPLKIISKQFHTFHFSPPANSKFVSVFGNFNIWNRKEFQMTDKNGDGIYKTKIEFEEGNYQYKFFADGYEFLDPNNPDSIANGLGGFNSSLIVKPKFVGKKPHITPFNFLKTKNTFNYSYRFLKNDLKEEVYLENFYVMLDNKLLPKKNYTFGNNILKISLNNKDYDLKDENNIRILFSNKNISSNILHTKIIDGTPISLSNTNFIWNDAIIYSLMIDRFSNGDSTNDDKIIHQKLEDRANFRGGDLQGIIDKINDGYFDKLGVNTLWISPFFQTTDSAFQETPEPHRCFTGYHGYWPTDSRKVEKRFGTNDLLKELINTAHKHNIKILMDFISNHVHKEHPYFKNHRDWFGELELPDGRKNLRLWNEHRLTTWFDPYIPSFDYLHSDEAIEQVVLDATWWIENYNIDGFRHDAVKHVPNKFWREMTNKIKMYFPEQNIYQIGETFGDYDLVKSYVNNGQLSAQFNFNLYWPARDAFARDDGNFSNLNREIEKSLAVYGQLNLMANIMDSHDQPRLASYLDKDLKWDEDASEAGWKRKIKVDDSLVYKKIEVFFAYLMTTPGIPTIYYGDEIGMTGASDPDNRRMMRWDNIENQNQNLKNKISKLTQLRNNHSALRYGDYIPLLVEKDILVYLRTDFSESILVIINYSENDRDIELEIPDFLKNKNRKNIYGNDEVIRNKNNLIIKTKPFSANLINFN